jgi:hypothetical protein
MARKLPALRSAMITTTAALITGSTADAIAQSTATYLSSHQQGIGALLITMTASCVLDRLNSIVNDTNKLTTTWIRPLNSIRHKGRVPRQQPQPLTGRVLSFRSQRPATTYPGWLTSKPSSSATTFHWLGSGPGPLTSAH